MMQGDAALTELMARNWGYSAEKEGVGTATDGDIH